MTNQEAISVLESINAKTDYFLINDDARAEAIDMAISALQEKELSETQKPLDTISRQAAIDALKRISFSHWFECGEYLSEDTREIEIINSNKALEVIEALPSAQPEIIRCKDCKWWSNDDYRECSSPNYDDGYVTPAGFYCGYAERRTDERTD